MAIPFSLLDLAIAHPGEAAHTTYEHTVTLAQRAEELGLARVWYAEHHNMASVLSSATAVLIGHVAAHTTRIRVGAGGIMLPNHAPLVIAEQFGTLGSLFPGRIDLGLGRAPGGDHHMLRALRRDYHSADTFAADVRELEAYLEGASIAPEVQSHPVPEVPVPLTILGSSLFGAELAARYGLPYAFASHFAPRMLDDAARVYREGFTPSRHLERPHFMAAANVIAAPATAEALEVRRQVERSRLERMLPKGREYSADELDAVLESSHGAGVREMMSMTATGTPSEVAEWLEAFVARTGADELIVTTPAPTLAGRIAALEAVAAAPVFASASGVAQG